MTSPQQNTTITVTGTNEMHWWSGDPAQGRLNQLRICVITFPAEGTRISNYDQSYRDWNCFNRWLSASISHWMSQTTVPKDIDSLRTAMKVSVEQTASKLMERDTVEAAFNPGDSETEWVVHDSGNQMDLPHPSIGMKPWTDQTDFHQSMLEPDRFLVGLLADGSLVTKVHESKELVPSGPHGDLNFCAWCPEKEGIEAISENPHESL